jgi:hypothetical protein
MITKEQIQLMIESLEELKDLLSDYGDGNLFTEQIDLLEYLKGLNN